MIGKLNHVAICVPNIEQAKEKYQILGAKISKTIKLAEHGILAAFVELENTKIELIEPLGENSPLNKFLVKNSNGGMHHICFEVENIKEAIANLTKQGADIIGEGEPKIGAHGLPVVFLHPKDFNGVLIELEERAKS